MGIRIAGLAVAVPKNACGEEDLVQRFGKETAEKIVAATGVKSRHVVSGEMKALELSIAAATEVFAKTGIAPGEVDGIVLITQTPEYRLPATACMLQDRLGIPKSAMAFDVNLGCSGYPYGIILANSFLESGTMKRMLLVVGDITSDTGSPEDQSTYPLFADAYSATIVERCDGAGDLHGMDYGTDGSGWNNLVNPIGQVRYRSLEKYRQANADERFPFIQYPEYTYMNGDEIFIFCLRTIPHTVSQALSRSGTSQAEIDCFLFHQANLFIIKHVARKMKIDPDRVPISIDRYGNTSSASIPLTACDCFSSKSLHGRVKVAMVGFGVGYSWSTVVMTIDPAVVFPIKEL